MIEVDILRAAQDELEAIPRNERTAIENAIRKLRAVGDALGYPHSSQIKGTSLRELRPRAGRSPWRALYQRVGNRYFVVAAIGPEAIHDPRAFRRAVTTALARLEALEGQQ